MTARSSITAALASAFLIAFLAEGWIVDVYGWVRRVTEFTPAAAAEGQAPGPYPGGTPRGGTGIPGGSGLFPPVSPGGVIQA